MEKTAGQKTRRAGSLLTAAAVIGASLFVAVPAANAATNIEVTSLGLGGNANPGVCEATTGTGDCTLRGALEIANASTDGPVSITFAPSLAGAGQIQLTGGAANSMYTNTLGNPGNGQSSVGPNGARYLIDSQENVIIDFTNLDGIEDVDGSSAAGFYIPSTHGVELHNLANLRAAEAGIAISGQYVTLNNIELKDPASPIQEIGVALLDGAKNVLMQDVLIYSAWLASIFVETDATVSDIDITGLESRGVENWAHIDIEDRATVTNFNVTDSVLGAAGETSPSHGFWLNPNITVSNLSFTDSAFHSPRKNFMYFEGGGQTFTTTVIAGNDISGTGNGRPGFDNTNISRVIGNNVANWDGLLFSENSVNEAQALVFAGSLMNSEFTKNVFTNINDGSFAAIQLGKVTENVNVSGNEFTTIWAHDVIRVEGTSAKDVVIEDNNLTNLVADVSRAAIGIYAAGEDNFVRFNTLVQDISGTDTTLPANIDNHWAIYNGANAANKESSVGWSIIENSIDGFGGKNRSAAPIVHSGTGKLIVVGNTLGVNTRGSFATEVENGANWMLRNQHATSNDRIQTYRAEQIVYNTDGTVSFKAVKPANLPANTDATAPVTLHVYWTAEDNAEEYLGAITGVTPDQVVSIDAMGHTDGFVRVQTVDANGYTSQYSAIDPDAPVLAPPAPPAVTETTQTSAKGTAEPEATFTIYDAEGEVVETGQVAADGTWTSTKALTCGTTYTVVQTADERVSEATSFTTAACDVPEVTVADITVKTTTQTSASGTGEPKASFVIRDAGGHGVEVGEVSADGTWATTKLLECGTTYTVTQSVGDVSGEPVEFTTAACATDGGPLSNTGAQAPLFATGLAAMLLAAGAGLFLARRRKLN